MKMNTFKRKDMKTASFTLPNYILRFALVFILVFALGEVWGQTTIWTEDFSYPNGTNTGNGSPTITSWTADGSTSNRGITVFNNQLTGRNTRNPNPDRTTWLIDNGNQIDISAYKDVEISIDISKSGTLENDDYIRVQYNLDNAGWITFGTNGEFYGDFASAVATQTGLNGTSLQIQIIMYCNANAEYYYADNIVVAGTPIIYYSAGNSDASNVNNWWSNTDGTGVHPANFTSGYSFIVQNGHNMTTSMPWAISGTNSKVQISNGGSVTATQSISLSVNTTFQIDNGGAYNHNNTSTTVWGGTEAIGNTSTINYGYSGDQNIEALTYGILSISGGGTKTLLGNTTATNNLTMTSGNINTGSNTLTLGNTPGSVGTLNYTSGTIIGKFERWIDSGSTAVFDFPVGTSTSTNIASIDLNTGTTQGSITFEFVAADPGDSGIPILDGLSEVDGVFNDGYWNMSVNGFSSTGYGLDLDGTGMTNYTINNRTRILTRPSAIANWTVQGTHATGTPPVVARLNLTEAPAQFGLGNVSTNTWYVFQDGNWSDPATWTLDASTAPIYNNPSSSIPGAEDQVIIRSGKSVTVLGTTNNILVNSIEVKGYLFLTTSTGHDFTTINGNGQIAIDGFGGNENFPDGTTTGNIGFADADNGGTLVINGTGDLSLNIPREFKNIMIDRTASSDKVILSEDYVVNGNLTVRNGVFQFGDGTAVGRSATVIGDVLVESNGSITTASFNQEHTFEMMGNFTNEGIVKFTNRADFASTADRYNPNNSYYTSSDATGLVEITFSSDIQDQVVDCNNTTYFSRIVIDKGVDDTYTLFLQTTDSAYFRLLGYANASTGVVTDPLDNANAFALINGTVKLDNNVILPVLSSSGNYSIPSSSRLWIDGGYVAMTDANAIVPYGIIEVTEGKLIATVPNGITLREAGKLKVDGGTVVMSGFKTSTQGATAQGTYEQNGGDVLMTGAGFNSSYATFALTYTGNVFIMTGGTLSIQGRSNLGTGNLRGSVFINCDPGNQNVSGGTVVLESNTTTEYKVTSRAPFYNVIMRAGISSAGDIQLDGTTCGTGGGIDEPTLEAQDLVVLSDLLLEAKETNPANEDVKFYATTSNTNINDVYIGGSFTIEEGGQYIACYPDFTDGLQRNYDGVNWKPDTVNSTYFNQTIGTDSIESIYWGNDKYFDYDGNNGAEDNENRLEFGNFILNRNTGYELREYAIATHGNASILIDANGNAEVRSGLFDQNRFTFRIWGNVVNQDQFGTYFEDGDYPRSGGTPSTAQIRLREDDDNQNFTLTTTEGAIFGNVRFNISASYPITLTSNLTIQRLEYMRGLIYLKNYNLTVDDMWKIDNGRDAGDNRQYFTDIDNSSLLDVKPLTTVGDNNSRSGEILIYTDGNQSDGGLTLKVSNDTQVESKNNRRDNLGPITFPIGFTLDGGTTIYNRPAQMKVKNYSVDGYVTVRPVSGELQTTDLSGGEVLQHYWNISHDFATGVEPDVAFRFYYYNQSTVTNVDLPSGVTNESLFVPGRVLNEGSFDRYFESDPATDTDDINKSTDIRYITFNGTDTGGEFDQNDFTGFAILKANYCAGESGRFVGAPEIFYTRTRGDGYSIKWNNGNNWTFAPNDLDLNGQIDDYELHDKDQPVAGDYPKVGDIAVIGWIPYGDGTGTDQNADGAPHGITADNYVVSFAELRFNQMLDINGEPTSRIYSRNFQFRPTLCINNAGGGVNGNSISGEGMFWFRSSGTSQADPSFDGIDIGDFVSYDSSYFVYESSSNSFSFDNIPALLPNLMIAGNGWGSVDRDFVITNDVTVNNDFELLGDVNLMLNGSGDGDFLVKNDLKIFRSNANGNDSGGNGEIAYPNNVSRSIEVEGDLQLINQSAIIHVESPDNAINVGELIIHGTIYQDNTSGGGLQLSSADDEDYIKLILNGEGKDSLNIVSGSLASLHEIEINKGSDTTSTFTFGNYFSVPDIDNTGAQPIEIVNGKLVIDDPAIDVTLANGTTGSFYLPNTNNIEASSGSGSLQVSQGRVAIEGDDTGLILDGKLTISGGELDMATGVGNGNNFIEYTASGNAEIEISSGTLNVGSQVRRSTTSTSGVLKYTQTGGSATFGIHAAPTSNRGVFEIVNTGSEFNLDIDEASGEEFTLVRDNNSTTVASLRLSPDAYNISDGSIIKLGNGSTPATQDNFGIHADAILKHLNIESPNITAKIYSVPLMLDELSMTSSSIFDAAGFNLSINNSLVNDGTFITNGNSSNNQTTYFPSDASATISGSGVTNFWDFEKSGLGTLSLSKSVTVDNNASILGGTLDTDVSAFNIKKDLLHDGIHTSDATGPGIIFNGSQEQNLNRSGAGTSYFGVVELNNAAGLVIADTEEDFQIDEKLILNTGVMDIGGNLLIFPVGSFIENKLGGTTKSDFNVNRMIQTNSSIRDFGVRKFFPATTSGSINFTYPVGLNAYTPVVMNLTDISASYITIRPVADIPPIAEDIEGTAPCSDPEIVDADNVLQYYWIIKSSGVSGLMGTMDMYYDPLDIKVEASEYTVDNYGPARLYNLDNTWDKVFTNNEFDQVNQKIIFPFTNNDDATLGGIYTAGVTLENDGTTLLCGAAIPDEVPQFITLEQVSTGNVYQDGSYQGGVAPNSGTSFDLVVKPGYTLNYDVSSVRTRKVTIESGATLEIGSGTNNHNLGFVTGEGNLKITSNTSSVSFPTGDYDSFFPDVNCMSGGGLEYSGTGSYSVLSGLPRIRNVVFSGSGSRQFPNNHNLKICEDLEILGTVNLIIPDGNNRTTVLGNIYKSDASSFDNGGGSSTIILSGTAMQYIRGDFTSGNGINSLDVNNSNGLSIINSQDISRNISANTDIDVEGLLTFSDGLIYTNDDNALRLRQSGSLTGYSSSRYIDGPFVRELPNNTIAYPYPVGNGLRYGYMEVEYPAGGTSPKDWKSQYFDAPATNDPSVDNLIPTNPIEIVTISGNEYWVIDDGTGTSGGESAKIGLSWDAKSDVSGDEADRTELTVLAWNDGISSWDNKGGVGHAGTPIYGTFTSEIALSFSENIVTLGSQIINNPLPVELVSFTGKEEDGEVMLSWETASEQNNDYFIIEHSVDGKIFTEIGNIAGAGTTTVTQYYNYLHKRPSYPHNYYRLKQVDFDGVFEYSDVILVRLKNALSNDEMDFVMYPNPSTGKEINIELSSLDYSKPLLIEVVTINGLRIVSELYDAGDFDRYLMLNMVISASNGVYIVHISQEDQHVVKKLVLK